MDRLSVAVQGFRTTAGVIDRLAIATDGFRTGRRATYFDLMVIGTPLDVLSAKGILRDDPVPALGGMAEVLDQIDVLRMEPSALGAMLDTPLATVGVMSPTFPVEDIAGAENVDASGKISDAAVPASGSMEEILDGKDLITDRPQDAKGSIPGDTVDVEGELF